MKLNTLSMVFAILVLTACPSRKKTDVEENIFNRGERIKTGFVWEKSEVSFDEIIADRQLVKVFKDDFNREELGENYTVQGGDWKIVDGKVVSKKAENRNLVLSGFDLPQNGVVKLKMKSMSDFVDIKFNVWGDGGVHDHGDGYSFILGGWKNRVSVISKQHEHEKNRFEDRKTRLEPNKDYHVKVVRKGKEIYWFVNDSLFLVYYDESPLRTENGFNKFSFGNWRSHVKFDDLEIYEFSGE